LEGGDAGAVAVDDIGSDAIGADVGLDVVADEEDVGEGSIDIGEVKMGVFINEDGHAVAVAVGDVKAGVIAGDAGDGAADWLSLGRIVGGGEGGKG